MSANDSFEQFVREQFTLVHRGIETLHGRITELERQQTDRINETRDEIRNWTDDRLTRHKGEHARALDAVAVAQVATQQALAVHVVSHPTGPGPMVEAHEEKYHNPVKTWTVIGGIIALTAFVLEILRNFFKGGHP